jgi:hypothetical protein
MEHRRSKFLGRNQNGAKISLFYFFEKFFFPENLFCELASERDSSLILTLGSNPALELPKQVVGNSPFNISP